MSMSLAWVAVQDVSSEALLERAGFVDTGEADEYFEAEHTGGELTGGWYVIVTEQAGLLEPAKLAVWSAGGRLVAAVVHEETSTSLAMEWLDGKQLWSVYHDGTAAERSLAVEGELPEAFGAIRDELMAVQTEADAEGAEFNAAFDIPLNLAEDITGFRHDEMGFDDEIPPFTILERVHVA
ncbi:MAG: hypothetical protein Q8R82_13625 [Hyphomonadaceae bacterium]|nr:hypothetical protein [Hyphomonadaceae bacterium]